MVTKDWQWNRFLSIIIMILSSILRGKFLYLSNPVNLEWPMEIIFQQLFPQNLEIHVELLFLQAMPRLYPFSPILNPLIQTKKITNLNFLTSQIYINKKVGMRVQQYKQIPKTIALYSKVLIIKTYRETAKDIVFWKGLKGRGLKNWRTKVRGH